MTIPKIYVFCNSCSHGWHVAMAIAEDGTHLAGHVCSTHGLIPHDMGVSPDGWKRDLYAAHYPQGFEVELVERPREHPGVQAAYVRNRAKRPAAESEGGKRGQ